MFEGITKGLESVSSPFRGQGKLTENNVQPRLRRHAGASLLEADVNYTVAQEFTQAASEAAVGTRVLQSP